MEHRLVVIQVDPVAARDNVEIFAKMMAGFAVFAAIPNDLAAWKTVDYLCWHPDLPEVDDVGDPPVGRWIMTPIAGGQAWHLDIGGKQYAHDFVVTKGADEVQGQ